MKSWQRLTLVSLACCARLAFAQLTLADDFDGSDGGWDTVSVPFPEQAVELDAGAAVSGALGLQFVDFHSDAGANTVGTGPALGRYFDGVGDQFVRTWWRVSPQTGDDVNISFIDLLADSAFGTAVEVKWNPSTSSIFNICFDRSGAFVSPLASFPLDAGFHLIETSGRNMGSANGLCQLAIDGVLVESKAVDFSAEGWELLTIGPVYGEYAWTGVMQFDSVIAGPTPAPSRLELASTGPLAVGVCEYVQLVMRESFSGGAASLPWPTRIELQVQGADVFADQQCAMPVTSFVAPPDVAYHSFYVRPTQRSVSVIARSTELMPVTFQVAVEPAPPPDAGVDAGVEHDGGLDGGPVDAGADGGERRLTVGCGCAAGSAEWALLASLALGRLRRGMRGRVKST